MQLQRKNLLGSAKNAVIFVNVWNLRKAAERDRLRTAPLTALGCFHAVFSPGSSAGGISKSVHWETPFLEEQKGEKERDGTSMERGASSGKSVCRR